MNGNPTPEQARAALAAVERAQRSTPRSLGTQTATILAGGLTFVGPLVGAAGFGITHRLLWLVGGLVVGAVVLVATVLLSRVPLRLDRGYRQAYLTSVLVNGGLYAVYLVLLVAVPGVSWGRALAMAAGLCAVPVLAALFFARRQRRADR